MEPTLLVLAVLASLALNLVLAATLALVVKARAPGRLAPETAQPAAIALPAPAAHGGSRREVILDLARQGHGVEAIAQSCGLAPGEVRLVLHLNAMEQTRKPATRRVVAA